MTDQAPPDSSPGVLPPMAPFTPDVSSIVNEGPIPQNASGLEDSLNRLADPAALDADAAFEEYKKRVQEGSEYTEDQRKLVSQIDAAMNEPDPNDPNKMRLTPQQVMDSLHNFKPADFSPEDQQAYEQALNDATRMSQSEEPATKERGRRQFFSKTKEFVHRHPKAKFALLGIAALAGLAFMVMKKGAKSVGGGGQGR